MTSADILLFMLLTGGTYHPVIHVDKPTIQKIHDQQQVTDDKKHLGNSPCGSHKQN